MVPISQDSGVVDLPGIVAFSQILGPIRRVPEVGAVLTLGVECRRACLEIPALAQPDTGDD
jgi:hypothetical protein